MSNLTTYIEARMTLNSLLSMALVAAERDSAGTPPADEAAPSANAKHALGLSHDEFAQVMAETQAVVLLGLA